MTLRSLSLPTFQSRQSKSGPTTISRADGHRKLVRLCTVRIYYAPVWLLKLMRLCTLHTYYAPVWVRETDEIMHPAQLLCSGPPLPLRHPKPLAAASERHVEVVVLDVLQPHGLEEAQRSQAHHEGRSESSARRRSLGCPYGYRRLMRVCTPHYYHAPVWPPKVMRLCTPHNYYAPV